MAQDAAEVRKQRRASALARLLFLSVLSVALAYTTTQFSLLSRFEVGLADYLRFSKPIAPSNTVEIIAIDEQTVRETGRYPYDRYKVAELLTTLAENGVKRVYFDAGMTKEREMNADAEMEEALRLLGKERIALPVSRIGEKDGAPILTVPHNRYGQHATIVAFDQIFDADRRVRRIRGMPEIGYGNIADWLNGSDKISGEPLTLNFAVDVSRIKRHSFISVFKGEVPASHFSDKTVIIGLQVASMQFMLHVPVHGMLSRTDIMAIAAESIVQPTAKSEAPMLWQLGVAFAITLFAAAMYAHLSPALSLLAGAVISLAWITYAQHVSQALGSALPFLMPPTAVLILWQAAKFGDTALGQLMTRQHKRIAGVGRNALVVAADVIGDPALVFGAKGEIITLNRPLRRFFTSRTPETITEAFGAKSASELIDTRGDGQVEIVEVQLPSEDGLRSFEASVRWASTFGGKTAIASLKDVTEARRKQDELATLAFKDALTGLANRMSFHARLTRLGGQSQDKPFAILQIDLDGFKAVNDTLGHHAGDRLLEGVARRLEHLLRPQDMAARLGGDEFSVLLPGADEAGAVLVAQRLLKSLQEPFKLDDKTAWVGASVGIALCPAHDADPHVALRLADQAMYAAKRQKPAYAVYSDKGAVAERAA